ncbi:hypothetical protein JTB14_000280 [Gonioctena quinquepunctata]|nr:hypothetical protein JTB14_000280 [Gonioctena quinquepunctata]
MIIHGFPNDISALRFEWAWQHPHVSRRLKHVAKKKSRERTYDFCLRILSEMLKVGPWCRLPLNIRWLNQEFVRDFPIEMVPPMHMPICHGSVVSKKIPKSAKELSQASKSSEVCNVCYKRIEKQPMKCLNSACNLNCHIACLSKYYLQSREYVPVEGNCPQCGKSFLWGDIVRKFKGCYNNLDVEINVNSANDFYESDSE